MRAVRVLERILTAIPMGALVGWVLGRSKEAALATATAGFIYALGPGHNIPFLGNMDGTYKGILYLLVINLVSAFVMMVSLKLKKIDNQYLYCYPSKFI